MRHNSPHGPLARGSALWAFITTTLGPCRVSLNDPLVSDHALVEELTLGAR